MVLVVEDQPTKAGDIRDVGSSHQWEDPLEEGIATSPVFLPGESHGQRSLPGYSPKVCKELNTTEATWHGMATLKTCFFRTRNIFYLTVLLGEDSELAIAGYQ